MAAVKRTLVIAIGIFLFVSFAAGCCNTHFKQKQLNDDLHTYCMDGDYEDLSEAQPDSGI